MAPARKTRLRVLRTYEGPPEARGMAALMSVARVSSRMSKAFAGQLKPFNVTWPHFEVLLCLRGGEGISQQELSERLLVTKGNICIILQKMEAVGLVERRADPTDQRFHRLYLADEGRKLLAKVLPEHLGLMQLALGGLSADEQKTLHELLTRVEQKLDEMEM